MGGGVPCGAIGGTDEVMGYIADGTYEQVGTFNGNPLTMAPRAPRLGDPRRPRRTSTSTGSQDHDRRGQGTSSRYDLAAYPLAFGAKGSVTSPREGPQLPGLPGAR